MALNHELSDLFHSLSALMELRGDNVFKVIAFQKVSRILRELNIDLKKCIEEGKLCEIEGIGKGSQQIIEEFVETGKSTVYEEVTASVPANRSSAGRSRVSPTKSLRDTATITGHPAATTSSRRRVSSSEW